MQLWSKHSFPAVNRAWSFSIRLVIYCSNLFLKNLLLSPSVVVNTIRFLHLLLCPFLKIDVMQPVLLVQVVYHPVPFVCGYLLPFWFLRGLNLFVHLLVNKFLQCIFHYVSLRYINIFYELFLGPVIIFHASMLLMSPI